MARRGKVSVSISADNSGLKRGVRDSEQELGRLKRVGLSSTRGLSLAFKSAGSVIAGAAIADQIKETIAAAQRAEVSQRKLQTQLRASGISYREHAKDIEEVIQKTSQLSGLDDEDLKDAFTAIIRTTGSVSKSMRDVAIAADLARAKHLEVARAGDIVAKVAGGNIGILSRYGITIRHGATATEALGLLQKKFAGQAESYGKTSAGAQDRFRVAVENLREAVGVKLLPVLTKVTNKVATFVNQMVDGTGAGGRFAHQLGNIADKLAPIAKFLTDHPRLVAIAVGAWATYRVAVSVAAAASRVQLLKTFTGLGPRAAAGGAVAGRSFGTAASASAGTSFAAGAPGALRGGKIRTAFRGAGAALGVLVGAEMTGAIINEIQGRKGGLIRNALRGLLPLSAQPGNSKIHPYDPKKDGPITLGDPGPTGNPIGTIIGGIQNTKSGRLPSKVGAKRSGYRAQGASVNIGGGGVVARAASVGMGSGVTARAAQATPGDFVSAVENEASRIDAAHVPYQWGGGHDRRHAMGSPVVPMDCSGAVSAVLGIDPRVSGDFASWGSPGDGGSRGITIYANRTHVLMKINGRFWGTSRSNPGGGPGWIEGGVSQGYLSGFTARHLQGTGGSLGSSMSASIAASVPKRLTATIGKTLSAVSKGMGAKASAGGFSAALTQPQIEALSGDPETNPVTRNMQLFTLAMQINAIDNQLKSGRISNAKRGDLLQQRGQLSGNLASLQAPAAAATPSLADLLGPGVQQGLSDINRDSALAALTPGIGDDKAAAGRGVEAWQNILNFLQATGGSSDNIAEAATNLKGARDALDGLTQAVADNTAAQLDIERQRREDTQRALNVSQSDYATLKQAFAAIVGGEIGGRLGLGWSTPSYAGAGATY